MLKVDLGRLAREHRVRIDADVPADDSLWSSLPWRFESPVELRLDVQAAGDDVVVRGSVDGTAALFCRRCTVPVRHELSEDLTLVFRPGLSDVEAQAEEVYVLPPKAQELDLSTAVVENVLLAVPQFVLCDEACRGFCARCGTNLNQTSCDCVDGGEDPRWAALRRLGSR